MTAQKLRCGFIGPLNQKFKRLSKSAFVFQKLKLFADIVYRF